MDLDDQLRRYFGTADLSDINASALGAGVERMRVDLALEKDRSRRFALWVLMQSLGHGPELDEAFDNEEDRDAARAFMDLADEASGA
jgi:hypothetical protein